MYYLYGTYLVDIKKYIVIGIVVLKKYNQLFN